MIQPYRDDFKLLQTDARLFHLGLSRRADLLPMVHVPHELCMLIRDLISGGRLECSPPGAVPLLLHAGHGLLQTQVLRLQELAILHGSRT